MAGDWIKMECSTPDKPEVFAITVEMGWEDPDLTVGKLFRVWRWFDQQTVDGNARGVTTVLLDRIAGATGFAQAMIKVGWLHPTETGLELPDFSKHNGATAKSRAQTAKRVANHRSNAEGNGDANADRNASTVTEPLAREEKRREDITTNPNGLVVASPAADHCPHQQIIALYHEVLPMCPRVRDWTPARATQLRARWNEDAKRQNLDWWRGYFVYVAQCDFLVGRGKKGEPFFADLEWITKSANFTKIREGKYENRKAA